MDYLSLLLLMGVMFAATYFFTIRPQKKRAAEMEKVRDAMQIGDQVVTIGGIRGRLVRITDDAFVIETADHSQIEFLKNALSYVVQPVDGYATEDVEAKEPIRPETAEETGDFTTDGFTDGTDEDAR